MKTKTWPTLVALAVTLTVTPLFADEREDGRTPPSRLGTMDDAELDARLDYLMQRLDERRDYATTWWVGWTSLYALGVVFQSTRAALENDDSSQADLAVSAGKAVLGTFTLLRHPLAWTYGASAVRALPGDTHADRLARLTLAEESLYRNAKVGDRRLYWFSHAMNVAINAAGAAIVHAGWDDPSRAWRSAGIGIAVGELMLFSHPWWYRNDWNEYERRFGEGTTQPRVSWHIVPTLNGVALHARF